MQEKGKTKKAVAQSQKRQVDTFVSEQPAEKKQKKAYHGAVNASAALTEGEASPSGSLKHAGNGSSYAAAPTPTDDPQDQIDVDLDSLFGKLKNKVKAAQMEAKVKEAQPGKQVSGVVCNQLSK
jgi:hypothetical protein